MIYDFSVQDYQGNPTSLNTYQGQVLIIVNIATRCGFTSQLHILEKIYQDFEKKLIVLAFPCNQFASQSPESDQETQEFCSLNYQITFPVFKKIHVVGPRADPLFIYLTQALPGVMGTKAIKWNFTKFIINARGHPHKRLGPHAGEKSLRETIAELF